MKSVSVAAAAALLAGISSAQPHGHHGHNHLHAKRDLVTEWETVWETVTVVVDESTTETLYPAHTTESGAPGEFYETPSTTTSTPEPTPTVETSTSSQAPPPPPPTTEATTSTSTPPPPPPAPTTTSTPEPAPQPEPETSTYVVPTQAETTTVNTPAPVDTPAPDSGSSNSGADGFGSSGLDTKDYSGDITYYDLGLGACGYDDGSNSENIVAISHLDWYARGPGTSLGIDMPNHVWCNKMITITANGKSTTAKVHDICPSCASGSIDVSRGTFMDLFGSLEAGRTEASWTFN
ncbi:hypothetical protein F5B22DRAFT_513373 [Xylaria bambusicola]|uniref:uncharacterized protein n=1 Tax=Xylaria bambusicola TaxID=326684 RepID=UPI0020074A72|nr:uncharacterized protein F5B22DRAFT_513373 [Xylaria bambusicola]KAI0522006.1 hypothetical protein F5B22DRAFT_513373 [Xylaria bambusicola]